MRPHERVSFSLLLAGMYLALFVVLLAALALLSIPSEISNFRMAAVLVLVVAIAGGAVWLVLHYTHTDLEFKRLAVTGVGLLAVGSALAFKLLPEHPVTGSPAGAIGVLPPSPGAQQRGFDVGLSARLQGCSEAVSVKLVVNGSSAYWAEHQHLRPRWLPFVLVLPGAYSDIKHGLGQTNTAPVEDPEQANIITRPSVTRQLRRFKHYLAPGKDNATVVSGEVEDWSSSHRPVIVTANARWITRRGVSDCSLQLPALAGSATALALSQALTCEHLDREYLSGICSDPRGAGSVSPALEVSEGAAVVAGGTVSSAESVPAPVEIAGDTGWRCRAPSTSPAPQIAGGVEAAGGSASASFISQSDCHVVATVLAPAWHHDFLLALIGALIGAGLHMMFQAMVDSRPERRGEQTPPPADPAATGD
jgi:hypothetical protein